MTKLTYLVLSGLKKRKRKKKILSQPTLLNQHCDMFAPGVPSWVIWSLIENLKTTKKKLECIDVLRKQVLQFGCDVFVHVSLVSCVLTPLGHSEDLPT